MFRQAIRRIIRHFGFDVVRLQTQRVFPPDFSAQDVETINSVLTFTMTGPDRILAVIQSIRYLLRAGIPGSIVECGVWRGGSMMAAALALLQCGATDRDLFLFDTFEGMTKPSALDISYSNDPAHVEFARLKKTDDRAAWCDASLEDVRNNLLATGYNSERLHFVKGKVEETIPDLAPEKIALLRLDTDWYESTRHELLHLYPRLSPGGVLIIDDYGHWLGARKATDEYFSQNNIHILLNRIDYTGRIAVKPVGSAEGKGN